MTTREIYFQQFGKPLPVECERDLIVDGECFWDVDGNWIDRSRLAAPKQTRPQNPLIANS